LVEHYWDGCFVEYSATGGVKGVTAVTSVSLRRI